MTTPQTPLRTTEGEITIPLEYALQDIETSLSSNSAHYMCELMDGFANCALFALPQQHESEEAASYHVRHLEALDQYDAASLAKSLRQSGIGAEAEELWNLPEGRSYLDSGLVIDRLSIRQPFTVIIHSETPSLVAYPGGHFLIVTLINAGRARLHAISPVDEQPTTEGLAEIPGLNADTVYAHCSHTDARWVARAGSWRFVSESGPRRSWCYDDATGHEGPTASIDCPDRDCPGRVFLHL